MKISAYCWNTWKSSRGYGRNSREDDKGCWRWWTSSVIGFLGKH